MGKGIHSPTENPSIIKMEVEGSEKSRVSGQNAGGSNFNIVSESIREKDQKDENDGSGLPLVIALNCLEDCRLEEEALAGVAAVEHVGLAQVAEGKIEAAVAVLLHSLVYLPRVAQRRLQPWQLILCLSSMDKAVDSTLANDLGLQLLHVDSGRSEEVADTVMALLLGLVRHTHVLAAQGYASVGWLGTMHAACRGMRRCHGLVLGIVGLSASACAVACRGLAFKMKVVAFDPEEEREGAHRGKRAFPSAVKKVESLKDLLSVSDMVTLHCALTNDTVQLINADTLQYIKPGAFLVNTSSSHLLDDCALKQALIEGTVAGCALDGIEGPQWLEAWVREMSNVLILPRSADYSEEVWMEIRAKVVAVLRSFLLDGVIPANAASDDEDDLQDATWQEECQDKPERESLMRGGKDSEQRKGDAPQGQEFRHKQMLFQAQDPCMLPQHAPGQHDMRGNHGRGTGKKGKKRSGRRKVQQSVDTIAQDREVNWVALPRDDHATSISGRDGIRSLNSRFASPEESKCIGDIEPLSVGGEQEQAGGVAKEALAIDELKEGLVIALHAQAGGGYYVARQRGPGRGWCLDSMMDVTSRDPAAQFLVVVRNRERIGLRSLAAGGKLLQANKKLELVFVNHTFDMWESWIVEGATLDSCSLTNGKFRSVTLNVSMEILAAVGEEDGVARWLS